MALPKPTMIAANLCDVAIKEAGSGKWSLIGLFTEIYGGKFPLFHPQLAIYFCVSGAQGKYDVAVELVYLNDDVVVGRLDAELEAADRLKTAEIGLNIRGMQFKKPGKYAFRLIMDKQFIGDKKFGVDHIDTLKARRKGPIE